MKMLSQLTQQAMNRRPAALSNPYCAPASPPRSFYPAESLSPPPREKHFSAPPAERAGVYSQLMKQHDRMRPRHLPHT